MFNVAPAPSPAIVVHRRVAAEGGGALLSTCLLAVALLLAACSPQPPATPSTPPIPPPPPPPRIAFTAGATGVLADARGAAVAGAEVIVLAADAQCRATGESMTGVTSERGEFDIVVERNGEGETPGCLILEAKAMGSSVRETVPVVFRTIGQREAVNLRLGPPGELTHGEADALIKLLRRAINDNDGSAIAELIPYSMNGVAAFRAALEDMQVLLGKVTATDIVEEQPGSFTYRLVGTTGRSLTTIIQQDTTRRIHNPLLYYSWFARNFVREFVSLVREGNAERMARLLTPDDEDFPVDRARDVIARYRGLLGDYDRGRHAFLDLDEKTSTIRYRVAVSKEGGKEREIELELGYGDGLLWLKGL